MAKQRLERSAQSKPLSEHVRGYGRAAAEVWRARRAIYHFLMTGDVTTAIDLRRRFGLCGQDRLIPMLPSDMFEAAAIARPCKPATIVIPVYDAPMQVERLLQHLPSTLSAGQDVILIDDGSTDERTLSAIKRFKSAWPTCQVIRHPENQGFIQSVNTALTIVNKAHHVILLNSDTVPPKTWVERLLAPFGTNDDIASVTPMSNNAQILSVPQAELETQPTVNLVDAIDGTAKKLKLREIELPTGIGFCIALNRTYLDAIGGFDTAFGRGYGEEVDWCMRARAMGARHVVSTNLFVGHDGGASFGTRERRKSVQHASRLIAERYPTFPDEARHWEQNDPVMAERLALGIAWLAARSNLPATIFIGHLQGGGAELALQGEVSNLLSDGQSGAIILRVGGPALWRIELVGRHFNLAADVSSNDMLHQVLAPLRTRRVVYSCGVGTSDPAVLPDTILDIAMEQRLELRLHDFYPISPSWNLIDSDGRYRGIPPLTTSDPAHHVPSFGNPIGLAHSEWRARWSKVVARANHIRVFAESGQKLLVEAYPEAADKIEVIPHRLEKLPGRIREGGQTIGILGGINLAKGGAVLEQLAKVTPRRIVLIGELDGQFRLPPPHAVHGRYKRDQIAKLAKHYQVGLWLIPSICPETFSFATHEALATGLPVLAFDVGAQADAVLTAENGHLLRLNPDDARGLAAAIETHFGL